MKISRRSVLHVSGLAAAALALTGCSASGSAALGGRLPGLLKNLLGKGEAAASSASVLTSRQVSFTRSVRSTARESMTGSLRSMGMGLQ